MKKYSILLLLAALSGCSMLDGMLSREFTAEDIEGKDIPAGLENLTLVYGRTELRFTNDYLALKGDAFDTYAARIVKIANGGADEFKLFISDGSKEKGSLRVNALYITNAGNNIYGYGLSNSISLDSPFPQVYTPSSIGGDSRDKIYLDWAVDEKHKPTTTLPSSHQGTYKSTWGDHGYIVSATGIAYVSSGYTNPEEKFLRIVVSGIDYECYLAGSAYKITTSGLYMRMSPSQNQPYTPGENSSFDTAAVATK